MHRVLRCETHAANFLKSVVFRTTLALCVVAAALGIRAGWRVANLTESEVIEAAVANYIAHETQAGRRPSDTDCSATPGGSDGIWIVVLCLPLSDSETQRTEYFITRTGRMRAFRGG